MTGLVRGPRFDVLDVAPGMDAARITPAAGRDGVPADRRFTLGDDRPRSLDSRYAALGEGPGLPALGDVVGRAEIVIGSRL